MTMNSLNDKNWQGLTEKGSTIISIDWNRPNPAKPIQFNSKADKQCTTKGHLKGDRESKIDEQRKTAE